jgi:deoxyadenosine/deoxycytidine kinase
MISIEGNVGVGKSTVLKILEKDARVREEQVEAWTLLAPFYQDRSLAFFFQLQILASFADAKCDYLERSPQSALLFTKILFDDKNLTLFEYELLKIVASKLFKPKQHIYLRLDAKICLERIKNRRREGEDLISLPYLEKIEKEHDAFFTNVIHLTGNESPEEIAAMIKQNDGL